MYRIMYIYVHCFMFLSIYPPLSFPPCPPLSSSFPLSLFPSLTLSSSFPFSLPLTLPSLSPSPPHCIDCQQMLSSQELQLPHGHPGWPSEHSGLQTEKDLEMHSNKTKKVSAAFVWIICTQYIGYN